MTSTDSTAQQRYCGQCGNAVPSGNRFCTTCGERVSDEQPPPALAATGSRPAAQSFLRRNRLGVAVLAVVILLIGFAVIVISHEPVQEEDPLAADPSGASADPGWLPINELSVGQCLSSAGPMIDNAEDDTSEFQTVPCDEPHVTEVTSVIPVSGELPPEEDLVQGALYDQCKAGLRLTSTSGSPQSPTRISRFLKKRRGPRPHVVVCVTGLTFEGAGTDNSVRAVWPNRIPIVTPRRARDIKSLWRRLLSAIA